MADALAYEVQLGRLRRPRRGRYVVGVLPRVTASRVRRRWREATDHDPELVPLAGLAGLVEEI